MEPDEINDATYDLHLANAAATGVRLGKSAEEIASDIRNVATNFWRIWIQLGLN